MDLENKFALDCVGNLNEGQKAAIKRSRDTRFPYHLILGPPGTGKTQTLAQLVIEEIRKGHKVLVSCASNTAVDCLFTRVLQLSTDDETKRFVRVGNVVRSSKALASFNLVFETESDGFRGIKYT